MFDLLMGSVKEDFQEGKILPRVLESPVATEGFVGGICDTAGLLSWLNGDVS